MNIFNHSIFKNEELLSKNFKIIVKNIETMNTLTYDYITAAEEEYKLNGKISNSNIYSAIIAYLDASYFYSMTNFDKRTMFYESSLEIRSTLNDLNGELFEDSNEERKIERPKWDIKFAENDVEAQIDQEKSIVDDIYNRISNYNDSADLHDSIEVMRSSPNQIRNWTVAPKLINNTNVEGCSVLIKSHSKAIHKMNSASLTPIGTKPKSMSKISSNKRHNRMISSRGKNQEEENLVENTKASIWSNGDSMTTAPIFNYNLLPQNKPSMQYKVSKLLETLINEFGKCNYSFNNAISKTKLPNDCSKVLLQHQQRVRSCFDFKQYNLRKKTYKMENIDRYRIGNETPLNNNFSNKHNYRRN